MVAGSTGAFSSRHAMSLQSAVARWPLVLLAWCLLLPTLPPSAPSSPPSSAAATVASSAPFFARAQAATAPANEKEGEVADGAPGRSAGRSMSGVVGASVPVRRVLLTPGPSSTSLIDSTTGVDWSVAVPFPSHAHSPLVNPHPLHVSLAALATPQRFTFEVVPALRPGAELIGFDWMRNASVGTIATGMQVQFSDQLPPWLQYVAPSSSSDRTFSLVITAPQSGDRATVYASPPPILLHFRSVLQYRAAEPPQPDEEDFGGDASASSDGSAAPPSAFSSPPLVLLTQPQSFALLVSLSIMPAFTQRVSDLASSFSLIPSPNLLEPRNRVTNKRGATQQKSGLIKARMDWRDEIVFACAGALGAECDACVSDSSGASTASSTSFCAFPSGSFFNAQSGTLRVREPVSILGSLQINAGATLEINHASPLAATGASTLLQSVSVIDCRDQFGRSQPMVNEGLLVVRNGHLVVYSTMLGHGAIHVHPSGSIEFVSTLPTSQVFYLNHTDLTVATTPNTAAIVQGNLGGISADQARNGRDMATQARTSVTARQLMQYRGGAWDGEAFDVAAAEDFSAGALDPLVKGAEAAAKPTPTTATSKKKEAEAASPNNRKEEAAPPSSAIPRNEPAASKKEEKRGAPTATAKQEAPTGKPSVTTTTSKAVSRAASNNSSNATSSSSSSSSTVSIASSPPPPALFQPHPSALLVSYGGAVLFSHGTFVFSSLYQSSLYAQGEASGGGQSRNRFVVSETAHVVFDDVGVDAASVNPSNLTTLPAHHLVSATQLHNLGQVSCRNATLNLTSILFFRSLGLLNFTEMARVHMDISDNMVYNRIDGWNGWRGVVMTEAERARVKEVAALLTQQPDAQSQNVVDVSNSTDEAVDPSVDESAASLGDSESAPSGSSSLELSPSLSTLLSAPTLLSRPATGGVGLVCSGFLEFRSGSLVFSGGFLARTLAHVFMRKGSEWKVDVEPTSSGGEEIGAGNAGGASGAASFFHVQGIEWSIDGVFSLSRGSLDLFTPLLQIEGHGQLVARGSETRVRIDNHVTNRDVHLQRVTGGVSAADDPAQQLVANPDSATDPDADLYSLQPASEPADGSASTSATVPPMPNYRECLIAPCLLTPACQSFDISGGAILSLAPLTFLHFLPRAAATVETTLLEGGALILDSGTTYTGNSFHQNSSDSAAVVNGLATLTAGVHIGNGSRIEMLAGSIAIGATSSVLRPAACSFAFGNLTGSGALACRGHTIVLEDVLVYPTFASPSPFSPIVYTPPVVTAASEKNQTASARARDAPSLRLDGDVQLTDKTEVVMDILDYHSISSLRIVGSSSLFGVLTLHSVNPATWPFDTWVGGKKVNRLASGVGLGEDSKTKGDTDEVASGNSTAVVVAAAPPAAAPTVDAILLVSSSTGFLPFHSPTHFSSVHLTSLLPSLPAGWSLDVAYTRTKVAPNGTALGDDSQEASVPLETQLWLKAYPPNYQVNSSTANATETSNDAQRRPPVARWELVLAFCACGVGAAWMVVL